MDLPVLIAVAVLALTLFIIGGALILHPRLDTKYAIVGAIFVAFALFILYGLQTQCPTVVIYRPC